MNADKQPLCIGLANFSKPTLLLIGNKSSFDWLASRIEVRDKMIYADLQDVVALLKVNLNIIPSTNRSGLERDGKSLVWLISPLDAERYASQLRALANSPMPAHSYLDIDRNTADLEIVASLGEYNPASVFSDPESDASPCRAE